MIDGALLLDKPVGLSSNAALQRVKRLFGAAKAGHAGTLDPLASGLLPVLFGEATKLAGMLLDADKEYLASIKLGESTATGDAEGEILERKDVAVSREQLDAALERFRGEIQQVPPMYSALKHNGMPLYRMARRGQSVDRPPRKVVISELELLDFQFPTLQLRIRCSKGTYVRTLAEDLGRSLGSCAHLTALRRTGSGRFSVREAVTLEALEGMDENQRAQQLIPLAGLLREFPRCELDDGAELRFRNGQQLQLEGLSEGLCAVYGSGGGVIGIGLADATGRLRPVRLTASQAAEKHQKNL